MKILLLSGEQSGVFYAERLQQRLRDKLGTVPNVQRPKSQVQSPKSQVPSPKSNVQSPTSKVQLEVRGYQSEGFHTEDLAVMGFLAVLRRIFYFLGVARRMKRVIREWKPDAVVTVDYPGLNLKLAAYAKARGIPAVHIVCPQVWAWHQGRIPKIAASITKLLCFFPFEPRLFAGYPNLTAKFIGHPMVDVFASEDKDFRLGTLDFGIGDCPHDKVQSPKSKVQRPMTNDQRPMTSSLLAVLPGSRVNEVKRNLPRLLEAIGILRREGTADFRVVIPAANDRAEAMIRNELKSHPDIEAKVQRGGARELLRQADVAAVASGTATLEAALARCPTVLVYAVSATFACFLRHALTGVKHVGLANIVWEKSGGTGDAPMPELLQENFTPRAVADHLRPLLTDPSAHAAAVGRLNAAMALLASDGDALGNAADEILASIGK